MFLIWWNSPEGIFTWIEAIHSFAATSAHFYDGPWTHFELDPVVEAEKVRTGDRVDFGCDWST